MNRTEKLPRSLALRAGCAVALSCGIWIAATGLGQAQSSSPYNEAKPTLTGAAAGAELGNEGKADEAGATLGAKLGAKVGAGVGATVVATRVTALRPEQRDEDIEIMRTILNQALAKLRIGKEAPPGGTGAGAMPGGGGGEMPGMSVDAMMSGGMPGGYTGMPGGYPGMGAPAHPRASFEGLYVKGCGVVFSATLPPSYHESAVVEIRQQEMPKPSTWEKVRKELSGEWVITFTTKVAESEPIHKVILRVLAENGHQIKGLAEDERVTVAVAFRAEKDTPSAMGPAIPQFMGSGAMPGGPAGMPGSMMGPGMAPTGPVSDNRPLNTIKRRSGTQAEDPYAPAPNVRLETRDGVFEAQSITLGVPNAPPRQSYELLGDLHLKQGRAKEAVAAYRKALETESALAATPGAMSRELARKLAQALLAVGDEASVREAQELLTKALQEKPAGKLGETLGVRQVKPSIPLPPKLIISVPKRLLDQVGTGKINFEEFVKGATVERVP